MTNPREENQDAGRNAEREPSSGEHVEDADREDDADRLRTLDELYERLESELEGDLDQEGPPGH